MPVSCRYVEVISRKSRSDIVGQCRIHKKFMVKLCTSICVPQHSLPAGTSGAGEGKSGLPGNLPHKFEQFGEILFVEGRMQQPREVCSNRWTKHFFLAKLLTEVILWFLWSASHLKVFRALYGYF